MLILVFCLLIVAILIYFKIADYYNIIDKPNKRSSHSQITIRGGGIVFPLSVMLFLIFNGFQYPYFGLGVVLISIISFLDDRLTLSTKPRLAVHLISVGLILIELGFADFSWVYWLLAFVLVIGWLNAFNFMDGINGITAFYALAVLLPLYYLNMNTMFVSNVLIEVTVLSLIVFSFFNARKKAKTFAGDVGSISMGLILAYLIIALLLNAANWAYILLVSVYGIDAVLTIAQRIIKKENIFEAHRSHLYQYLANEAKWSHLMVSLLYAFIQLSISILVISLIEMNAPNISYLVLLISLGLMYLILKALVVKKYVEPTPE